MADKKNRLDLRDIILCLSIIGVILLIMIFYIFYRNPNFVLIAGVIGGFLFGPIFLVLGYFIFNPYQYTALLRILTKRNYGIVNIIARDGKHIQWYIKDFNNSYFKIGENVFILNRDSIYIDKGEGKEKDIQEIDEHKIKFRGGIPTINFTYDNFAPLDYFENKGEGMKSSDLITAIDEYASAETAEKAAGGIKMIQVSLVLIVIAIGAAAYFSYANWDRGNREAALLQQAASCNAPAQSSNSLVPINTTKTQAQTIANTSNGDVIT